MRKAHVTCEYSRHNRTSRRSPIRRGRRLPVARGPIATPYGGGGPRRGPNSQHISALLNMAGALGLGQLPSAATAGEMRGASVDVE